MHCLYNIYKILKKYLQKKALVYLEEKKKIVWSAFLFAHIESVWVTDFSTWLNTWRSW